MSDPTDTPIAYELQARFASDEGWVTLDVCASEAVAERRALCRRDRWGRAPRETRVVAVPPEHAS